MATTEELNSYWQQVKQAQAAQNANAWLSGRGIDTSKFGGQWGYTNDNELTLNGQPIGNAADPSSLAYALYNSGGGEKGTDILWRATTGQDWKTSPYLSQN